MSVDTTMVVLRTKSPTGSRPEYRVHFVHAAETLDVPSLRKGFMWRHFREEEVFTSAEDALQEAFRRVPGVERIPGLEYGVRVYNFHPDMVFPTEDEMR